MATPKFTARNALVSADEPYQTVVNCRAVLGYVAPAIHENELTDSQKFGRYLILASVKAALEDVEKALEPKPRLEVANA